MSQKSFVYFCDSTCLHISVSSGSVVTAPSQRSVCARLRIMMKMHGLGDSAYWIIQYTWFLFIYCCYIAILLLVGSAINLKFFRLTNYGLQIIFFFVWGNCLIAFAFLASIFFTNAKTANVVAFLWVFGTGLLNNLLMENYYKDHHSWVYIVELIPSFALYRALYEQVHLIFQPLSAYVAQAEHDCNMSVVPAGAYDQQSGFAVSNPSLHWDSSLKVLLMPSCASHQKLFVSNHDANLMMNALMPLFCTAGRICIQGNIPERGPRSQLQRSARLQQPLDLCHMRVCC